MNDHKNEHNSAHDKKVTIIVNTREKEWSKRRISYREVVELAFGSYSDNEAVVYTITYAKGESPHKEGSLVKDESVKVKKMMIFNVSQTNKS